MAWGLFPIFFAAGGADLATVGLLTALAPAVWGIGQLGTGAPSDRVGRKWLIAAVGDVAHPSWRGAAVGVYLLWRDIGFAVGAILAGALADVYSITVAIVVVAGITAASGLDVGVRMRETHQRTALPGPT